MRNCIETSPLTTAVCAIGQVSLLPFGPLTAKTLRPQKTDAESVDRAKILAVACHPYLSGVPHRIGHVERTFEALLSKNGVAAWDGARILDWYLGV
ncbi:MAG: hypothetical protein WBX25_15430 [Rhodomicrobium sp.]